MLSSPCNPILVPKENNKRCQNFLRKFPKAVKFRAQLIYDDDDFSLLYIAEGEWLSQDAAPDAIHPAAAVVGLVRQRERRRGRREPVAGNADGCLASVDEGREEDVAQIAEVALDHQVLLLPWELEDAERAIERR